MKKMTFKKTMAIALLLMYQSARAYNLSLADCFVLSVTSAFSASQTTKHICDVAQADLLTDCIIKLNAAFYSADTRAYIQNIAVECGVTATVIATTGKIFGGCEEMSFAVVIGKDDALYLNIPIGAVAFLNDTLQKIKLGGVLSEKDTNKFDRLSYLIMQWMNRINKITDGTSLISRNLPLGQALVFPGLSASLALNLAHCHGIPYLYQLPLHFALAHAYSAYIVKQYVDEIYECDSKGIDKIELLQAGKQFMLTEYKNHIQNFFAQQPGFIQNLYKKYPKIICPLFTTMPDPDGRAQALQKKIEALEGQQASQDAYIAKAA
jgi:hypothetical protein